MAPLRELVPIGCFGHSSVKGPEALAATIDCLVDEWGHAASLDFAHAFDVVTVSVLQQALAKALHGPLKMWSHSTLDGN